LLLGELLLLLVLVDGISGNGADERPACSPDQCSCRIVTYCLAGERPADCTDSGAFLCVVPLIAGAGVNKKGRKDSKNKYGGFHKPSFQLLGLNAPSIGGAAGVSPLVKRKGEGCCPGPTGVFLCNSRTIVITRAAQGKLHKSFHIGPTGLIRPII
jgi:hypothetical protein